MAARVHCSHAGGARRDVSGAPLALAREGWEPCDRAETTDEERKLKPPGDKRMRTIVLVLSLIAFATPIHAASKGKARADDNASMEKRCHDQVGKESGEGEGRSHMGQLQAQRFSDCMMGH
jgi:hypothetical protein